NTTRGLRRPVLLESGGGLARHSHVVVLPAPRAGGREGVGRVKDGREQPLLLGRCRVGCGVEVLEVDGAAPVPPELRSGLIFGVTCRPAPLVWHEATPCTVGAGAAPCAKAPISAAGYSRQGATSAHAL